MYQSSHEVERDLLALPYVYREEFKSEQSRSEIENNGVMLRTLLVLYYEEPDLFFALGVFGVPRTAVHSLYDLAYVAYLVRRFSIERFVLHGSGCEGRISGARTTPSVAIAYCGVATRDLVVFLRDLEVRMHQHFLEERSLSVGLILYRVCINDAPYVVSERGASEKKNLRHREK